MKILNSLNSRLMPILFMASSLILFNSCDSTFLDKKPASDIELLLTLDDLQHMLDNAEVFGKTGSLQLASCDDYYIVGEDEWNALGAITERNAYVWAQDLFGGETPQADWNGQFNAVFHANAVLDRLVEIEPERLSQRGRVIKGSALFLRAYAYFDLAKGFCEAYDEELAAQLLGLPLRTQSGIDVTVGRSTLQETYDFIIADLTNARLLLEDNLFPINNRNRPSLEAAYGMMARVYLAMGVYEHAALYADSCLSLYPHLIDYNNVCMDCATPFSFVSDETIFSGTHMYTYPRLTAVGEVVRLAIDTVLIDSYADDDLRLQVLFLKNRNGNYNKKRGYIGSGSYDFSGLATDEVFLIRAEGYARSGHVQKAMDDINRLLSHRYKLGTFVEVEAGSAQEALDIVLMERRKTLVWRGTRWSDLKRLNRGGANIIIERILGEERYILAPNDPKYAFPIPDDEIAISGIQQNQR